MKKFFTTIFLFVFALPLFAYDVPEKDWGIAIGFRSAKIPFKTEEDRVQDFIPLMFYDGDIFFMNGLSGGIKLYDKDAWQFSLLGRYRYFDIPAEYQNLIRGDALDVGGRLKYRINNEFETYAELMSDEESRHYATLNAKYHWQSGSLELFPYLTLRYKSADFNNYYFGLDGFTDPASPSGTFNNKIGSALDLAVGSELRYHVISNFYLIGRAQLTVLDSKTSDSVTIDGPTYGEIYLGIAFFNDSTRKKSSALQAKPYIRVAHGWATPSSMGEIVQLDIDDDPQDNQLTSIFYGHPIADSIFGIEAIDLYITTGYIYHHAADPYSQTLAPGIGINTPELAGLGNNPCNGTTDCTLSYDYQPTNEYIIAIKAYYNVNWPLHWRFGFAEGISYIETVSHLEQREMDRKGYRSSNLMNYLDFTADLSVGDAFGAESMKDLYFGFGIHHRSSIFESSSAFGRIKGGSNYLTLYMQYHF